MKSLYLLSLILTSNLILAQGMLQNIDQNYSYFKLQKNGTTAQMRIFECSKNSCTPLVYNNAPICFNFNPVTENEVKLYYRSGLKLLHQKLIDTMGLLIARHNPKIMTVGISSEDEFANTINTQLGEQLKMISTEIPSILGATNWVSKYNNIRFIGLFKEIMTSPVIDVIQSRDDAGNIQEEFIESAPNLSCIVK